MIKKILTASVLVASMLSAQAYAFQTIVLVRHGEKVDDSRDPLLSDKGQQRAQNLARMLRDANIEQVFATEYQRTQLTAKPLAETRQLTITPYSAKESLALGEQLRQSSKNTLVVGHSNTVNTLLKGLGAGEQKAIAEDEFDRMVIVHLNKEGAPAVTILRY
jgi:broad specificity phosphatase PhoE